jgi:hypothetical protein
MPDTPTLDDAIRAAEQELARATDYASRRYALDTLGALNAQKLAGLSVKRDAAAVKASTVGHLLGEQIAAADAAAAEDHPASAEYLAPEAR